MSATPFKEEEGEDHRTKQVKPIESQKELIRVMHTSLHNIAIKVHDLHNCADDLLAQISKEGADASWRFMVLQKRITQLMDVMTHQGTNKESHLQVIESKEDAEITLPTEQVSTSQPLPVTMYDRRDACGQTLALNIPTCNYQHDTGLKDFSDSSYSFGICKKNVIAESKEQKQEKLKEQKHLCYRSEPESVPLRQRIQDDVSVDPSQAACGEMFHSWVYQPVECFSFPMHSFSEVSGFLTGAVGKTLASPLYSLRSGNEYLRDTQKYVRYGIGKGEKVEPQPPTHHKTEVFVSPTAPSSPPPLPPDWLARLRQPKGADDPGAIHSPSQSPSSVLLTSATSQLLRLQTTPEAGLPLPPTNVDLSPSVPKLIQYCEVLTHDLHPPEEDKGQSPTMSPLAAISGRTETKHTVTNRVGHAPVIQSPASVVFPSARSTFAQPPKHSATRVSRYSVQSTPRSSLSASSRYPLSLAKSSTAPSSGVSTQKSSQSSAPLSLFSHPQASQVSVSSGKHSCAQPPRLAQSRSVGVQSARTLVTSSERPSVAQSTRHLIPPQQRSSSSTSTRSSVPQSHFSSTKSPSSCQTLLLSQSSKIPVSSGTEQSSSSPSVFSRASNALVEALRKGLLPSKAEDQCLRKANVDISKNKASSILICQKAMGGNAGKSEKKAG